MIIWVWNSHPVADDDDFTVPLQYTATCPERKIWSKLIKTKVHTLNLEAFIHHKCLCKTDLCTCCPWAYDRALRLKLWTCFIVSQVEINTLSSVLSVSPMEIYCSWIRQQFCQRQGMTAIQCSDELFTLSSPLAHAPCECKLSSSNGLFIDIPILQLTLYWKRQTLPRAYKCQSC